MPNASDDAAALDLVVVLSYYAPYVSGLTEAARVVAERLVERGWRVGVATSRHDDALPQMEVVNGVVVDRSPVVARIRKGVVVPTFPYRAARMARRARVANLHLPMIEAGLIARLLKGRTPVVTTYACDVQLSDGAVDKLVIGTLDRSHRWAMRNSDVVVATTSDYGAASRLSSAIGPAPAVIAPPCLERPSGQPRFRESGGPHIGFLGRIVAEKGLEYLIRAFRGLDDPDARLLIAGDYDRVAGGSVIESVRREIGGDTRIRLLGFIPDEYVADFYASLDAFVLPSVNSLEAFGIVQVEAMLAGVPVIATDMPGVRVPVQQSGFGTLVPPRDAAALRAALDALPPRLSAEARERVRRLYGVDAVVDANEELLERVAKGAR